MHFNLRTRLILLSVAIATAALLALALANFLSVQRHVNASVNHQGQQLAAAQAQAIGNWVEAKRLLTHNLVQAIDSPDPRSVIQALRDGGGFANAFVGFPDKSHIFLRPMPDNYDVTARPWYQQAIQAGKPIVTEPYIFTTGSQLGVTFAEPVGPSNRATAVLGADVLLTDVVRIVASIRPTPNSFAFLANQSGTIVTHPNPELTLQPAVSLSAELQPTVLQALGQDPSGMNADIQGSDYLLYGHAVPGTSWQLVVAVNRSEALASLASLKQVSAITVIISLAIAIALLGLVIARSLRRLTAVRDALQDIASGDGDLTRRLSTHGHDELTQIALAFNQFADKIAKILLSIRASSEAVRMATGEIASGTQDLSSRTEQQASSLEETSAATEQLAATVQQNADNARQANQLATDASQIALQGGTVVTQVVKTMAGIEASSQKIADISGVINSIAFQTNILALNAAVEAARAGDQGRGFAVVATEVRSLAQRSATAAKEIKELIDASVQQVSDGSRLVQDAGTTMHKVVDSVRQVTTIVAEISHASQEQSTGIAEIANAVSSMDQGTQQNAALVEEASAAAQSLQQQAAQLAEVVAGFKLDASSRT